MHEIQVQAVTTENQFHCTRLYKPSVSNMLQFIHCLKCCLTIAEDWLTVCKMFLEVLRFVFVIHFLMHMYATGFQYM